MVRGLDIFQQYFGAYPENYIIIGGTACDILMEEAELTPRATKDIDLILIVEALNANFVKLFWQFIQDGKYERQEKSNDERQYYRFMKPENTEFPFQIELFSRTPDEVDLEEPAYLTPIPVDDDLSSLSAILMSDDYYDYLKEHSATENEIHLANLEALICLKAKAFLEISERIAAGGKEDSKNIKKHKNDVFKLAAMLSVDSEFELPHSVKKDFHEFLVVITDQLPDKVIYKDMGLPTLNSDIILKQLIKSFKLKEDHDFSLEVENLKKTQKPKLVKIEKSKENVLAVLENVYFPLLKSVNNNLSPLTSLFEKSTWTYFEEPKGPDYETPLLPVFSTLEKAVSYFKSTAKKGNDSHHDFKAACWLMEYKDEKQFGIEIAFRIHFYKHSYKIEAFIGQPFQSSKMLQMFTNIIKTITQEEPIEQYRKFDLLENNYDATISEDDLKSWALTIRNQTLEVIKNKMNKA